MTTTHTIRAEADHGCVLLSAGPDDDETLALDLTGAGMERLLESDGSTVWVGVTVQYTPVEVTVTVHDTPPGPVQAWHATVVGLDLAEDLVVRDGYVEAIPRGTVSNTAGRWTARIALPVEPDPLAEGEDVVAIIVDLWPPVDGDPDVGEVRLVTAGAPQDSAEEDTGAGTRQRRGALAWDSRMPMRLVRPAARVASTGYLTLHLDEDGALWGFWYDAGVPMLTEVEAPLAARLLDGATIHGRMREP